MEAEKKLCPFRRRIYTEVKTSPRVHVYKEKFSPCEGIACMAYHDGACVRLEKKSGLNGKEETTWKKC